jgi:hypothetical protein
MRRRDDRAPRAFAGCTRTLRAGFYLLKYAMTASENSSSELQCFVSPVNAVQQVVGGTSQYFLLVKFDQL